MSVKKLVCKKYELSAILVPPNRREVLAGEYFSVFTPKVL